MRKKAAILFLCLALGCLLGKEQELLLRDIAQRDIIQREEEKAGPQQNGVSSMEKEEDAKGTGEEVTKEKAEQAKEEPMMRVLLMTDDFAGYYHSSVTVRHNEVETVYTPETMSQEVVQVVSQGEPLFLPELKRGVAVPSYQGTLEIRKTEQGLLLINELPLEEYLYGVVPSEMPASYELEALKAQAVCARTYAYTQYREEKLKEYTAHVDDSVSFQVYGNVQGDARTRQAVDETRGEILCQNGEPIQAYYFSTSSGATSTDEVWEPEKEADYLQSVACIYDAGEPWSQWEVFFSMEDLNRRVQDHYGDIGEVLSLEVLERSSGGAVTQLRILTEKESRVVHNEYDIRSLFSPEGLMITRKDQSQMEGGSLLPSAYFRLDAVQTQEESGYKFLGGGYGHGVGMSQNGANHMAMEGQSWEEILHYFFKDVTVTTLGELL